MKEEGKGGMEDQKIVDLILSVSGLSALSNWFPQHVRSEKEGTLEIGSALSKSQTTERRGPMSQRESGLRRTREYFL